MRFRSLIYSFGLLAISPLPLSAQQQLQLNSAIDPNRVFLLGEGDASAAAYSCSLQKSTPFAGFCLLSAPFRTAALPSLALAKGRRFYIQTSSRDQGGVSVLSGVAEAILKRQGANVKAEKYQGEHEFPA